MKRVLIVASVVSFLEWFNRENLQFLKNTCGCQVHIACNFDYTQDTDEERTLLFIQQLQEAGFILHNLPFARSPFSVENLSVYRQLKKILEKNRFDLIHCHTPTASMLTRLAAEKNRRQGSRVMYTCHGFHFHNAAPLKNWLLYYPVERILSWFCDDLVTINREDYRRAQTFHCKNVHYIPGVGVDVDSIRALEVDAAEKKRSIGVPENALLMISAGELIPRKNHEVILRAMARLGREDLYYAIAGKGPLLEHLHQLAGELGIADRVRFLGFRTDVFELYRASDISAFPSRIEGLGLAGIEAMAAGLPLVSSNVHGILDYVKDGQTGYALPPDDVEGFAAAIGKLAEDEALRETMVENCRKAAEPFSKENALKAMWRIYMDILEPLEGTDK